MPTVTHKRLQPSRAPRWTFAAQQAEGVLSLPMSVARVAYGLLCKTVRSEGIVAIDGAATLCRARIRRDGP